ncbi:MAG: ImmA/IrrE family metallo-endopeptidase, partial [Desulfovibrionaceae bacterium]|nr:ImmA/IrrE family metallo-endopeptidase [Desulfovibrionaceae bacterium]
HAGRIESSGRDGAWLPLLVGGKEKKVRLYATLTVNARLSPEAKLVTAAHELGHYLCGHMASPDHEPPAWDDDPQRPGWEYRPDDPEISLRRREFEAESVAWLVCERLELINPSARYLAHYVGERGEIPNVSLDAILKAAGQIETMLRRVLPVDRYRLISEESEERARRGRS